MVVGWIKLYRKFLEWEWYTDSKMVHLFIHLLLSASIEDRKWKGIVLQRGQLATTYPELSKKTGLTVQNLRTCLEKLENSQIINRQVTNKYTLISVCNFESYQAREDDDQQTINRQLTDNQQTTNRQLTDTIAKELKKLNNDRIVNNNNNTVYVNNYNAHTREGFSFSLLSQEEQQSERSSFFKVFFWANVVNPRAEVQKFIRHNERHSWKTIHDKTVFATPSERKALAEEWAANEKCRKGRTTTGKLNTWWWLWNHVEKEHPELEWAIIDIRNDFKIIEEIKTVVFYCAKQIRRYLETEESGKAFLEQAFPGYKVQFSSTPLNK